MLWVVQGNLTNENNFKNLIDILVANNIEHVLVKPIPYTKIFVKPDFDSFSNEPTINDEPYIDVSKNIVVIGSYTLSQIAKDRNWKPGAFMDNLTFNDWKEGWGVENLLNGLAIVEKLKNISVPESWNKFFARPVEDTKSFSGTLFEKSNFEYWKKNVIKINESLSVNGETEIIIAPLQSIKEEYRFFVIDGKVVTGSLYKLHDTVIYAPVHNNDVIDYAKKMVDKWQPNRGFCLDIARTENGFKIIEVNGLNSAGFYCSDLNKIVEALENMNFTHRLEKGLKF